MILYAYFWGHASYIKKLSLISCCYVTIFTLIPTLYAQNAAHSLHRRVKAHSLLNHVSFLSKSFVFELRNKKSLDQSSDGQNIFIFIYDLFAQKPGSLSEKKSFEKIVILTIKESETEFEISIQERDQKRPCLDHSWHDAWSKEYDLVDVIKVDLRQELMLILCLNEAFYSKNKKLCCSLCCKNIFSLNNIMIDHNITMLSCGHIVHKACLYTRSAGKCCPFCKHKALFSQFKAIYAIRPFNDLTADFFT